MFNVFFLFEKAGAHVSIVTLWRARDLLRRAERGVKVVAAEAQIDRECPVFPRIALTTVGITQAYFPNSGKTFLHSSPTIVICNPPPPTPTHLLSEKNPALSVKSISLPVFLPLAVHVCVAHQYIVCAHLAFK